MRAFSAFEGKLNEINQLSLAIPGSGAKFAGLEEMSQTFARSHEGKAIKVEHFMRGIQNVLTNDGDFVVNVLKNANRFHVKVIAILKGNSL